MRYRQAWLPRALLAAFLLSASTNLAYSQDLPLQRDQKLQELQELEAAISISQQRHKELANEISQLDKDRVSINRSLIESSKKSRSLEKRIDNTGEKLGKLRDQETDIRSYLRSKQALLSEVLAALQRMGRKPPPALLVSPEDALSSVRSAILLGSVVPEVRAETDILLSQLKELKTVSDSIEEQRASLSKDLASLNEEEERLRLLLDEKQKLSGIKQTRLAEEQAKATELAAKTGSLNELITSLETQIESVREAEIAAKAAEEERRKQEAGRLAAQEKFKDSEVFSDPGRKTPAISFKDAKGLLPTPVRGEIVSGFGDKDDFGEPIEGQSLLTRVGARVLSPADGWIVYAGPFRTYGQLLIINAGDDYHIVLAGMNDVNVRPGQFVIVGEPIGQMGAQNVASTNNLELSITKPILYVEFRKGGKPIDPSPWWADTNLKRVSDGS